VPEPDRLTPRAPATVLDAATQVFRSQAAELRRHQKAAKRGTDPEAVHQMRVATRRLRAACRALEGHVVIPAGDRDRLRWLARRLGAVRDLDVILELLEGERLPPAAREERARLARLVRKLRARRRKAHRRLARALAKPRYRRLLEGLDATAKAPRLAGVEEAVAARVLAEVGERLAGAIARSPGMTVAAPDAQQLHALRIDFKRLRYALELHAAAYGFSYDEERKQAREMQEVLGNIHDRDLLLGWMAEGRGVFRGPWRALEARLAAERARLLRRFFQRRHEWLARTRAELAVAVTDTPRWVHLEPQAVTLRLVSGTKSVAAGDAKT
jgi:CHAD domain-containing protein